MNKSKPSSPQDKPFKLHLRLRSKWLLEGFIGICPTLSFIVILIIANMILKPQIVISGCREREIRILGMVLQLLGFLGVAYGLRQASSIFRVPSLTNIIKEYIKRFPSPKNHIIHGELAKFEINFGKADISQTAGPESTLEVRVALLEDKAEQQRKRVGDLEGKLHNAEQELKEAIDLEKVERDSGDAKVKNMMAEAVVGGIHIEWYSLLCFIIGIILASASPEISSFFGHLSSCIK